MRHAKFLGGLCAAAAALAAAGAGAGPIHEAARSGDLAQVRQLAAQDTAQLAAVSSEGESALLAALAAGKDDVAAFLLTGTGCVYGDPTLDVRSAAGERARRSGAIARAAETLGRLVRAHPDSEGVNFAFGIVNLSQGDYARAALSFQRVLMLNPNHQRARVELAVTDYIQGYSELARAEFEDVLKSDPEPAVRAAIQTYLDAIRDSTRRWRMQGRVDVGGFYDDNVNVGPDSDTVSISPIVFGATVFDRLQVAETTRPASDAGVFAALSLMNNYDFGDTAGWQALGDLVFYENWLKDEHDDESRFGEVSAGIQHDTPRRTLRLPATVDFVGYGGERLCLTYGATPSYRVRSGRNGQWAFDTSARAEYRDWNELDERDGWYVDATEFVRRYFGSSGHSVGAGVTVIRDMPDADVYTYTGCALAAEGLLRLPLASTLALRARYRFADYDEREVLAPETREDNQWLLGASLSRMWNATVGSVLSYQYTTQDSTYDLYEYNRNVATLGVFYLF